MLLRKATLNKIQSSEPLKGYHIFNIKASTFKGDIIDSTKKKPQHARRFFYNISTIRNEVM